MKHFSDISATGERILDAAQGLVQQRGYSGFSYDDVARLVDIRKPSIHHHFPTKAELVVVLTQRYSHRFREQLLRLESQHARAPDRLRAYAELFDRTFALERRLCLCGMLGAEAEALPAEVLAEVQRFFQANLEWLAMVFDEGQRAGLIRAGVPAAALAEAYLAALEGAMVVGRGLRSVRGMGSVAATFLSTVQV